MRYVPGLDAVRFLAAVIVLLFHTGWKNQYGALPVINGWAGVEIFFIISGFVICGSSRGVTPLAFVRRRIARLYPAAICCLLLDYAFLRIFGVSAAFSIGLPVNASKVALLSSLTLFGFPYLVGSLWTLSIELGFYTLVFLFIARGATHRMHWLAYGMILWSAPWLIAFSLSIFGLIPMQVEPLGYGYINMTFLRHGCFFGLGILLFLNSEKTETGHAAMTPDRAAMIAIALGLCMLEVISRSAEVAPHYLHPANVAHLALWALGVFLLGVAIIWGSARFNDRIKFSDRNLALLRTLGLMSYPIYLLHEAVAGTVTGLLAPRAIHPLLAQLSGLIAVLLASLVIVNWIEPFARKWFMRLMDPALAAIARIVTRQTSITGPSTEAGA